MTSQGKADPRSELAGFHNLEKAEQRSPVIHRIAIADVVAKTRVGIEIFVNVMLRQPFYHQRLAAADCQSLARGGDLGQVLVPRMAQAEVNEKI